MPKLGETGKKENLPSLKKTEINSSKKETPQSLNRSQIVCKACQDSGKDSKGGTCYPCLVNRRIK